MKKLKLFLSGLVATFALCLLLGVTANLLVNKMVQSQLLEQIIMNEDISKTLKTLGIEKKEIYKRTHEVLKVNAIKDEDIDLILDSDGTKHFLSVYLGNALRAILENEDKVIVTKEDLEVLLQSNLKVLKEKGDYNLDKIMAFEFLANTYLNLYSAKIIATFPTSKSLLEEFEKNNLLVYKNINFYQILITFAFLFSDKALLIMVILFDLSLLGIYYLNKKSNLYFHFYLTLFAVYASLMILSDIIFATVLKKAMMNRLEGAIVFINYFINMICKYLWVGIIPTLILSILCYTKITKKEGEKI